MLFISVDEEEVWSHDESAPSESECTFERPESPPIKTVGKDDHDVKAEALAAYRV